MTAITNDSRPNFLLTRAIHNPTRKDPTVHSFIPPLLELYSRHLAKDYKNRYDTDPVYQHFASVDFESVSDFRGYAEKTFSRAVDVIQLGVPVVVSPLPYVITTMSILRSKQAALMTLPSIHFLLATGCTHVGREQGRGSTQNRPEAGHQW